MAAQTAECRQTSGAEPQPAAARLIVSLTDLTSLNDNDSAASISALCAGARGIYGAPAALCIYKEFLPLADKVLAAQSLRPAVRLATVANFPLGEGAPAAVADEVAEALALGADEVDIVFPWRALLRGDAQSGRDTVRACRKACAGKKLKVILESGALGDAAFIRRAAEIAIGEGADFIKTSTGKAAVHATLPAAEIMLESLRASGAECGLKVSGGVRSAAQAEAYLALAERIMGAGWVSPAHFRFGASGLLAALAAGDAAPPQASGASY